jgi:hypothetical protein
MGKSIKIYVKNNRGKINLFIWLLYFVLLCFVSHYHEPWHDEAQAWLIARDDSIWQLLTVTTHYEGHPPLWHLCLMSFAKLGVPYELGLKSVNIFFGSLAAGLVICKSPLPWYLRFTIPFSYFFFYQYGVINRSYSLLLALIMLAAYYYPQRETKPYHLALSLGAMAATQAYGMMLAFGIALAWLWEIVKQLRSTLRLSISGLLHRREVKALLLLLIIAVFNGLLILPKPDTAFMQGVIKRQKFDSFFYALLYIPGQIIYNNDFKDSQKDKVFAFIAETLKQYVQDLPSTGIYGVLIIIAFLLDYSYGFMFLLFLFYISYLSHKLPLFVFPTLSYVLMVTFLFWNQYHAGILAGFYVFLLWQIYSDSDNVMNIETHFQRQFTTVREYRLIKIALYGVVALVLGVNIYWSAAASYLDVTTKYDISRSVADYIKDNNLTERTFSVPPSYSGDNKEYITIGSYGINGYFDHNMIQNMDGGVEKRAYHQYQKLLTDEIEPKLRVLGAPDFILATEQKNTEYVSELFAQTIKYVPVQEFRAGSIWKTHKNHTRAFLFAKNTVAQELHLPEIKLDESK